MSELARVLLEELAGDPAAVERLRELVTTDQGPEPWVGVQQAAEHLNCKPQRIYDLVHQQTIPHHRDGARLLFKLTELDQWLEQ